MTIFFQLSNVSGSSECEDKHLVPLEERHNPRGSLCPSIPPSSAGIKLSQCPNRTRKKVHCGRSGCKFCRVFKWLVLLFVPVLFMDTQARQYVAGNFPGNQWKAIQLKWKSFFDKWHILQFNSTKQQSTLSQLTSASVLPSFNN
jgi:hypothetical protein